MCSDDELNAEMIAYYAARAEEYDGWYLRHGRYSHGPESDAAWAAEMAQARDWLAALPMTGEIAELAAGTGWWSPVLCAKGPLSLYDASAETLALARVRLADLGLAATFEERDAWDEPDRAVGGLFTGFWLSHVARERLGEFLGLARHWLEPGGTYAFIDSRLDPESGASDHRPPDDEIQIRRLEDGSAYRVRKIYYTAAELSAALRKAGFEQVDVQEPGRFFIRGSARAG
jgi:hypothetical protein